MFKSAERKRSQGFTLAEVLIVVAIIGILLAVAIPNVISYYRSLKLTELDDSAKTIFMAAQSRLTAMTSAGQDLYALSDIDVNDGGGTGKYLAVTDAKPDGLASLVPGGSIESQLHDNHYVVEIDPKTGAVYAVWYWEKEDFTYTSDAYVNVPSDKGERLKKGAMVGYYGGSEINRPDLGQMPIPQLTVINAEELRLEIRIPDLKLDSSSGFDETYIRVSVLVNGKTIIDNQRLGDVDVKNPNLQSNNVGKVILDTLKSSDYTQEPQPDAAGSGWFEGWTAGAKFAEWNSSMSIGAVPGDDINVTVVVSYLGTVKIKGKDTSLVSQSASVRTNSLFASVKDDGTDKVAEIAYGRHLQNLDTSTSGVNETSTTITAAVQTRSIDFNDNTSVKDVYSWADTYGNKMFKPIENASLTSYNGHEYEIRNLNIQNVSNDPYAYLGLFGLLTKTNLDDTIKFENTILVNTESEEGFVVGALVGGLLANGNINNCHVYLDEIGADGKLRDLNPRLKGSSVGGLVGMAFEDLTMINCSAATVISGTGNVGGLVSGVIGVCKISKSYAACNITGAYVGGLVGNGPGGVTIQNSYAAGTADVIDDASKARKVAGLVNWSDDVTQGALPPTLTNSYAAVRYGKSVTNLLASKPDASVYGACEITPDMKASSKVSELYYVKQAGITYKGDSGVALSVSELKGKIGNSPFNSPDWYVPGGGATVNPRGLTTPYKVLDSWLADPYPYPMLANNITAVDGTPIPMPHYGDWLENSYATSFYWENEKDSAGADHYHFYLVMSDGATKYVADGLCPDHHLTANMGQDIDAWGYGLIGIDAAAVDAAGLNSFKETNADVKSALETFLKGTEISGLWKDSNAPGADTLKGITDLLSDANNVILLKGAEQDDFHAIETGAGWLELNLGFAAAIDVTENTGTKPSAATNMGKTGAPYQIRTVRQLDNIPNSDSKFYEQTHDLYGKDYDADTSNSTSDVYSGPTGFSGNYNGGSYRILELDIDSGLFTSLSGADLHDIILYSPTGEAKNTSTSGNVGGLAGSAQNVCTIENCIVAGYKLSVSSSGSHVGGLIGDITNTASGLKITNCAAVNTLSGATSAGGLVGRVGSTVNISDSYAGGTVNTNNQYAGGIVGNYNGNVTVNYNNVYSYAKITSGFFVYGIGPQGNGSYNNCRYWTGGNRTGKAASDAATSDVTGVSLAQLESGVTAKAEHTYRPGSTLPEGLEDLNDRTPPSTNDPYPYPAVVTVPVSAYDPNNTTGATVPVHYGEWPVIEASATYVEIYTDDITGDETYGLYGYLSDTNTQINTLRTDLTGVSLIDDCYGLLVPDGDPCPDVIPVNGGTLEPVKDSSDNYVKYDSIYPETPTPGDQVYDFYRYDFASTPGVAPASYYQSITLNKQEFWVNFDYGCEVIQAPTAGTSNNNPLTKTGTESLWPTGTTSPDTDAVIIRTARQLANMATATGSVTNDASKSPVSTEKQTAQARKYEQLLAIDYSKYDGLSGMANDIVGRTDGKAQPPAALAGDGSYNGNGFSISNLHIEGATYKDSSGDEQKEKVGLFGELNLNNGASIQNITLVNVKILGTDFDRVGALAGNVRGYTTIDNCSAYAADYSTYTVTGKKYVGGLVGVLGSTTKVTNSFATVKVTGTDCVGGFAGQINGSAGLGNCYSGGRTDSGAYANDANVTATNGSAGGFAGKLTNFSGSGASANATRFVIEPGVLYSTCSVAGEAKSVGGVETGIGLFAGEVAEYFDSSRPTAVPDASQGQHIIAEALSNGVTSYALGSSYNISGNTATDARDETYLQTNLADFLAKGATATGATPYDTDILGTKSFPYLTAYDTTTGTYAPHYGDWPEIAEAVFYWEQEEESGTNAYNFYAKVLIGDNVFTYDTLCDDYHKEASGHEIKDCGYGTFTTETTAITMKNTSAQEEDQSDTTANGAKGDFDSKVLTKFKLATSNDNCKMYRPSSNSGETSDNGYYINLGFAASIAVGTSNTFGTATNPYEIRTAGQLDRIPNNSSNNFRQTHDIYGGGYTDNSTGTSTPRYTGAVDFAGTYDGNHYRILDLSMTGRGDVGLFASTSGNAKLESIILYAPTGATINGTGYNSASGSYYGVGGLIGKISGNVSSKTTINNCVVAGYTITGEQYVGGLVGYGNYGTDITNSEAVNNITCDTTNSSAGAGGILGGLNNDGALLTKIANCYAGGEMTVSGTSTFAGGIIGINRDSDTAPTVENSYTYVDMSGCTTGNVYTIGYEVSTTGLNTNFYLNDSSRYPTLDSDHIQGNYSDLISATMTDFGKAEADHTFIPSNVSGLTGPYPYPAVVTDDEGKFVHYGDWPNP